ncbi:MAG TPA: SusD/RagB family nutrient-binding outer membrane lipoprotein [Marinilabiliaceae bacterium]|nr:SusD/RagB family nutrient-binding outer membrane lipoprotein [Marinilabiliaceae bacterium]HBX89228.1 SusD/RagB family nutrient-binding outer membrane lipoprotein [Marinilabiliaceae bacterium]
MKRVHYISLFSAFLLLFAACSEDKMDEINKNVNDPTDVSSDLILPDLITSTAFSVVGSDLAFYSSVYVEHNVGVYGQLYNAEIRTTEPTSATTYNNSWDTLYRNLKNLRIIIDKCSEGGPEEGNVHMLGMAQVLMAYNLAVLTDLMGDVPWSEALQPGIVFTPKLDSQESIYEHIFVLLDEAIANFEAETKIGPLGSKDLLFGSLSGYGKNYAAWWTEFAYGLKARYTMRLSLRSPDYEAVLEYADKSFSSPASESKFRFSGDGARNPFAAFSTDRNYFGASTSLKAKLTQRTDPRDTIFFKPAKGAESIVFAPNGNPNQVQDVYGISGLTAETNPIYLLSYHEIEFLRAEAYVRLNQPTNALAALEKAVVAALTKPNVGVTEEDAEDYFETVVESRFNTNPLAEVMVQKYLAFYEEEAIEAYNDVRRLRAMGNNVITLAHPQPAQFPLRFTYGSSDVTTNENIRNAYGNGAYVYTENVWWAGGTK